MARAVGSQLCHRWTRLIVTAAVGLVISGCASVRYYAHVAHGESSLLLHRRPLDKVIADPATPPVLAGRLRLSQQARRFASSALELPDNRSYASYVQLQRPYVAWNVFAAPRYSVDALPQCFPIAGCVAYRGYFKEAMAQAEAGKLKAEGNDVWVGGVPAYSTLGWFADPILSSMMRWDDDELAGTIFHELAHQLIYVKGDTAFNESFATFVERQGLREWRMSRGLPAQEAKTQAMDDEFTALVLDLRRRLAQSYARGGAPAELEAAKRHEIEDFRQRYRRWRAMRWPDEHGYDAWVAAPINNARLLPFGLYDQWIPAFAVLFRQAAGRWPAFYGRVRALAGLPRKQRELALKALLRPAAQRARNDVHLTSSAGT